MADIEEVAAYDSVFSARIAIAHLESVGITATLAVDDGGGAFPSLTPLSGGARILVRSQDVPLALDALEELHDEGEPSSDA